MEELEDFQTIFHQDEYEFEEDWNIYDEWLDKYDEDLIKRKRSRLTDPDVLSEKLIDDEEADEVETIITSSSSESESAKSIKSESVESLTHPCLKEINISDSELKFLNIYKFYPIPEDPGLDRAFWVLYPDPPDYRSDGVQKFFDIMKVLKSAPIAKLAWQLKSDKVDLSYYGIDPEAVEALSEAMLSNRTVKSLILRENPLTPDACYHLNRLLLRNTALKLLNLSGCKIGEYGAMKLEEGISISPALRELDLSRCELGNEGLSYITTAVAANALLQSLNISNNTLDEGSAIHLQKMFVSVASLQILNLSWNDLCTKEAAEKIYGGLTQNDTLTDIDLSWNSIGKESIFHMKKFISNSKSIKRLNLSANRFTDSEILHIAQALLANKTLEELRLNQNPSGSNGITDFIKILASDKFIQSPLLLLHLGSFWATKDVLPALDKLKEIKPHLVIKLGGILGNYPIIGPDLKELYLKTANYDAMNVKKKTERKNFGHFVLSLEDSIISKERFRDKLEESKIKISENLANEIMNQFLVTKRSFDQAALKETYMSFFPDTKLPEPPPPPKVEDKKSNSKNKKGKNKKDSSKKDKKGKKSNK